MINDQHEAINNLTAVELYINRLDSKIASLEDKVQDQAELIYSLKKGNERRDQIIQEKNDIIESLRR